MPVEITDTTVTVGGSTFPSATTTNASNIGTNTTAIADRVQKTAAAEQSVTHTMNVRKLRINNSDDSEVDGATAYMTFDGTNASLFNQSTQYVSYGSNIVNLHKDGSLADGTGFAFAGSTAPGTTTNKLYRSGNELFYDGSDITGALATNASNISTLQSQNPDWGTYTTATDTIGVSGWASLTSSSLKYVTRGKMVHFHLYVMLGAGNSSDKFINGFPWNAAFDQGMQILETHQSAFPFTGGNEPGFGLFANSGSAIYFYKNQTQQTGAITQAGSMFIIGNLFTT